MPGDVQTSGASGTDFRFGMFLGERSPPPPILCTRYLKSALKKCQIWSVDLPLWSVITFMRSAADVPAALCSSDLE